MKPLLLTGTSKVDLMKQLSVIILLLVGIGSQTALGQTKKKLKKGTPMEQQQQKGKLDKEDAAQRKAIFKEEDSRKEKRDVPFREEPINPPVYNTNCEPTDCSHYEFSKFQIGGRGSAYFIKNGRDVVARSRTLPVMEKVDDIFRFYRLTSHCFIGDEFNKYLSIWYSTDASGNQVFPTGAMPDEDCIEFNPDNLEVKFLQNEWKLVDGNNWIARFGQSEREANDALCLIQNYGLTNICFSPGSRKVFQYMRK